MRRWIFKTWVWLLGACLFFSLESWSQPRDYFHPTPQIQKYAVIIVGATAEEFYRERFQAWSFSLYETLTEEYRYAPGNVILLFGKGDEGEPKIAGAARKEVIEKTFLALQKKVRLGDQIFFFLLGHGTSDPEAAKYNIVGPDITGEEFAKMLEGFVQQDLIVVNTTSASFPFSVALSAPGRIVISATRSSAEKYDTLFAEFFVEAFQNRAGDSDKNTRLSVWEAFQYAKKRTEKWYAEQNRLPTEHPVLDDNADGQFSLEPNPATNDGSLSQVATFDLLTQTLPKNLPRTVAKKIKALTAKMLELERSVLLLRNEKAERLETEYRQQLEVLLIELARTTRQLRRLEKKSMGKR